jgi:hypothetical protein
LRHVIEFAQEYEAGVALLRLRAPGIRLGDPEAAAERLTSILKKREVPVEVLPDGAGTPLEEVSRAAGQRCGLVVLMKPPPRFRRSLSSLPRAILQGVPLPLLVIGDGSPTPTFLETPAALRMRI